MLTSVETRNLDVNYEASDVFVLTWEEAIEILHASYLNFGIGIISVKMQRLLN